MVFGRAAREAAEIVRQTEREAQEEIRKARAYTIGKPSRVNEPTEARRDANVRVAKPMRTRSPSTTADRDAELEAEAEAEVDEAIGGSPKARRR